MTDSVKMSLDIPRMNENELEQFVKDYLAGHITTSEDIRDASIAKLIFMPLAFADPFEEHSTEEITAKIGAVYGNRRKHQMARRFIDGYPIFFECAFVHKEDWKIIADTINREFSNPTRIKLEK
jgi:hypothetical protein